jgi:hypothetical protein
MMLIYSHLNFSGIFHKIVLHVLYIFNLCVHLPPKQHKFHVKIHFVFYNCSHIFKTLVDNNFVHMCVCVCVCVCVFQDKYFCLRECSTSVPWDVKYFFIFALHSISFQFVWVYWSYALIQIRTCTLYTSLREPHDCSAKWKFPETLGISWL